MKEVSTTEKRDRLLAGAWFEAASFLPIFLLCLLFIADTSPELIFFALPFFIPAIFISFVSGVAFGSDILNPNKVKTSGKAMLKGAKVALFADAIYIPLFAIGFALRNIIASGSEDTNISAFLSYLYGGFIISGFYGLLLNGWLLPIIGAVVGCLLYQYRLFRLG